MLDDLLDVRSALLISAARMRSTSASSGAMRAVHSARRRVASSASAVVARVSADFREARRPTETPSKVAGRSSPISA
jgi:hypothetical protein